MGAGDGAMGTVVAQWARVSAQWARRVGVRAAAGERLCGGVCGGGGGGVRRRPDRGAAENVYVAMLQMKRIPY